MAKKKIFIIRKKGAPLLGKLKPAASPAPAEEKREDQPAPTPAPAPAPAQPSAPEPASEAVVHEEPKAAPSRRSVAAIQAALFDEAPPVKESKPAPEPVPEAPVEEEVSIDEAQKAVSDLTDDLGLSGEGDAPSPIQKGSGSGVGGKKIKVDDAGIQKGAGSGVGGPAVKPEATGIEKPKVSGVGKAPAVKPVVEQKPAAAKSPAPAKEPAKPAPKPQPKAEEKDDGPKKSISEQMEGSGGGGSLQGLPIIDFDED